MTTATIEREALTLTAIDWKEVCDAQLKIRNNEKISARAFRAALHRIAAEIEEATPANERRQSSFRFASCYAGNNRRLDSRCDASQRTGIGATKRNPRANPKN